MSAPLTKRAVETNPRLWLTKTQPFPFRLYVHSKGVPALPYSVCQPRRSPQLHLDSHASPYRRSHSQRAMSDHDDTAMSSDLSNFEEDDDSIAGGQFSSHSSLRLPRPCWEALALVSSVWRVMCLLGPCWTLLSLRAPSRALIDCSGRP